MEFKANVNVMDRWNNTPLDDAMRGKHEQIVALLIAHGGKQGSVVKQEAADDKERELKRELDSLREQEEKARELSEEAKHPKPTDATSEEEDTDPLCRQLSTQSEDWVPALSEAWSRSSPAQFAADGSDGYANPRPADCVHLPTHGGPLRTPSDKIIHRPQERREEGEAWQQAHAHVSD